MAVSLLSTSLNSHTLPPQHDLFHGRFEKKERVYTFFGKASGVSGNPPIDYRVHLFFHHTFLVSHPFWGGTTAHGACRDNKEMATQRQSKFPSLRWAGDHQGRRCRERNTMEITGNPELNESWSLVVAPVSGVTMVYWYCREAEADTPRSIVAMPC